MGKINGKWCQAQNKESLLFIFAQNNSNRRWVSSIELADFSLTVRIGFIGRSTNILRVIPDSTE